MDYAIAGLAVAQIPCAPGKDAPCCILHPQEAGER
jgi:hypothetical protein